MKTARYYGAGTRGARRSQTRQMGRTRSMGARGRRNMSGRKRRQGAFAPDSRNQLGGPIAGYREGSTQPPGIGNLSSNCLKTGRNGSIVGLTKLPLATPFSSFVVTDLVDSTNTDRIITASLTAADNVKVGNKGIINASMSIRISGVNPSGSDTATTKDAIIDSGQFRILNGSGRDVCVVDSFDLASMVDVRTNDRYGVDLLIQPPYGLFQAFAFELEFLDMPPSDDPVGYTVFSKLSLTWGHIDAARAQACDG